MERLTSGVLNRRDFLGASAAALALASTSCAAETPMPASGYVDAHSHIWSSDVVKYPLAKGQPASVLAPPSFSAEELLAIARPNGVTRVVLIQHKPYFGVDNRYLADVMAAFPGVFSGVACINAEAPNPGIEMHRLKTLGFRGFRICPGEGAADRWSQSSGINEMWATAADTNLAICPLLGADHLDQVDEMAARFPRTKVVVDHFARIGGTGDFPEADLKALLNLAKYPLVHVKVSAFYFLGNKKPPHLELAPMIRRVLDAFGADRLMWGSDCPYQLEGGNNYTAAVKLISEGLDFLSASDKEAILRGTATKVFFSKD